MTARLEALRALKAKVEAGEWADITKALRSPPGDFYEGFQFAPMDRRSRLAWSTYHGSLDAAKALHEAVLLGWGWNAGVYGARVWPYPDEMARKPGVIQVEDHEISPARAWLLAIFSALIALEEAKQ
ncbi:hypothetical protein JF540_22860 [Salipiger thiooxidans]|uniref:hypothetical protein n=1 Tax=Salipiger thiooxidans TaxID=282683 RepID=UPI001A8FBBE4|nr:hypothetical protein [Salipiger thiooxidans]MBN8189531.1 hypothetical protein [Salipiger thiooxidans]